MINRVYELIINRLPVILYGAGEKAREQIAELSTLFNVLFIWDRDAEKSSLEGYDIRRPFDGLDENGQKPVVLITIENDKIRRSVSQSLETMGFDEIFYSEDILQIVEELRCQTGGKDITKLMESFLDYEVIDSNDAFINYSIVKKDKKVEAITDDIYNEESLSRSLEDAIVSDREHIVHEVEAFIKTVKDDKERFFINYELFLRNLLREGVKTKYRPIRMNGDRPYDPFAVYEVQKAVISFLSKDDLDTSIKLIEELRSVAFEKRYLDAIRCHFCVELGEFDEAIDVARQLVKRRPTAFFENEIFYEVACDLSDNGIEVEEKLPKGNLHERFCWSGMNYVWCGGMDKAGNTLFAPCFRAVECAARPQGRFSDGEEWQLFRESIIDGSFRYCQKAQCPNLIGGWLPKKCECNNDNVSRIINNEKDHQAFIEELHLSYDKHCNLKCPSCRTGFCTNTDDDNNKLDDFYDRELSPIVSKAKHLCLSGCGEALLSPHSRRILINLPEIASPDLKVELRTNMTVLNRRTWESLQEGKKYIRHIAASIDGCTRETFEKLRYPANWNTVRDNLSFVAELRRNNEIDLFEFHVVIQRDNIDELYDLAMLAISLGADAITYSKFVNWMGLDEAQYADVNPFWLDHPRHEDLMREIDRLKDLRQKILDGTQKTEDGKPFYISIHFENDPGDNYHEIRYGDLKIR